MAVVFPCSKCGCDVPLFKMWLCCSLVQNVAVMFPCSKCGCDVPLFKMWLWCSLVQNVAVMFPCSKCGCCVPLFKMWLWCSLVQNVAVVFPCSKCYCTAYKWSTGECSDPLIEIMWSGHMCIMEMCHSNLIIVKTLQSLVSPLSTGYL